MSLYCKWDWKGLLSRLMTGRHNWVDNAKIATQANLFSLDHIGIFLSALPVWNSIGLNRLPLKSSAIVATGGKTGFQQNLPNWNGIQNTAVRENWVILCRNCFVVFFSRRLKIEKITKDSFVVSVCEDIRRIERVMRGAFPGWMRQTFVFFFSNKLFYFWWQQLYTAN